ncbi:MAG TPA: protein kinase [Gemmatimonadaceae bacterium]
MTDPSPETAAAPMTPERWRAVDAILRAALECERERRDAFVVDACGGDERLEREVASLLAAHDGMAANFLEQPAVDALGPAATMPPGERTAVQLAAALAGRYAIEREIARGGMATVYLARDRRHARYVAVKVMRAEVAAAVGGGAERFLEEIRVTASLQHPHILPLFDSGSGDGLLWYVMPYVEGETLRSRLMRDGRLPIDESVRIAREVADALDHAHARGIVHRDVKPENILLRGGHALVSDFGIALALETAGGDRLTRTGLTLGTPQYMAPEQASGERALDARVDVYALGAVVHEMLTGEPPFAAPSRQVMFQRILAEPPTAVAERRPEVPPSLDAAVRRALAKRPGDRFPSAAAFATSLGALGEGSPSEERKSRSVDSLGRTRGTRMVAARVAMYAAAGGVGLGLLGGWGIAHTSLTDRLKSMSPTFAQAKPVASTWPDPGASSDGMSLVVVDREGGVQQTIPANRPWTPRFSPDGGRVAYGAFGAGRNTSDVWVRDLGAGTTRRVTDDDADSNDPQWSPDGKVLAYSVSAAGGKDVATQPLAGGGTRVVASRPGIQFPSDWPREGALIVTDDGGPGGQHDIVAQPLDGSPSKPYVATGADETAGRVAPNEHWIAYVSNASGQEEVYLDAYPRTGGGTPRMISQGGGRDPVWRGDGRELYYWRNDELVAVSLVPRKGEALPTVGPESVLFRAPYQSALNTMYDVSPDGNRFVIVEKR